MMGWQCHQLDHITGRMSFLLPNQQHASAEGKKHQRKVISDNDLQF